MRKAVVIGVGTVLVVAAAILVWSRLGSPEAAGDSTSLEASAAPTRAFSDVAVTAAGNAQGLTLTGTIRDAAGAPVSGAEVQLAATGRESLASVTCHSCGEPLLSCAAHETVREVASLFSKGVGFLSPGASTQSGPDGTFRFEHLQGVSFTVWAEHPGLGTGVRERAAPGEPVELFLPSRRTLAGWVRDDKGAPIRGAKVYAVSRRVPLRHEAQTGADGRFELGGLGEGPFYVLAEAKGFLSAAETQVDAGSRPLRLSLSRERFLDVRVTRGGKVVEDATVRLVGDHLQREQATEQGRTTFASLPADELLVSAKRGTLAAAPRTVELTEQRTSVELALEEGAVLFVTPVDDQGQPVEAPKVSLFSAAGELVEERKASTGELVRFGPVGTGDYFLAASAPGFQEVRLPLLLEAGEKRVELVLSKGLYISGRVLDEYGRAAPDISVLVNPTGLSVIADAQGKFSAEVPSPGLYTLHAHHSDWGGAQVEVTAPADGVELSLEPRAGAEIVVQAEGRRLEGADVTMWLERQGSFRSDRPSGADGVVKMRGMPAGSYWMVASHPDYLPSARQRIELTDGELLRVTAELGIGGVLQGQTVDEAGAPVAGVALSLIPRGTMPTTSDGEGQFELRPLRPSTTYRLEARHPSYEQPVRLQVQAGGQPVRIVLKRRNVFRGRVVSAGGGPVKRFELDGREVNSPDGSFELPLTATKDRVIFAVSAAGFDPEMVDRPAAPELGDICLEPSRKLEGTVTDGTGPVEGAVVSCDVCERGTLTGADGRFELSRPAFITEYLVTARKATRTASMKVPSGTERVELRLEPAVQLQGIAYLSDGRPAAGEEIEILDIDRSEPHTFVTARDGSFTAELAPGFYRLALGGPRPFRGSTQTLLELRGSRAQVTLGPAPGSQVLEVQVRPEPGHALWLIRGDVTRTGNPPVELQRASYGQVIYVPAGERVQFHGVAPGRYTLVWGHFHAPTAQGPVLRSVNVPAGGPVSLFRSTSPDASANGG